MTSGGIPGLFWGWNPSAGRYVDLETGRFIPRDFVFDQVDTAIQTFALEGEDFIRGAIRQGVPLEVVERVLMQEIKDGYINSYVAGRGGRAQMTPRDWGIVGRMVRTRYEFVRKFMDHIAIAGRTSEKELIKRWQKYYDNMTWGYWKGDQEAARAAGKTEMIRHLNSSKPCRDCPGYSEHWEEIGKLPLPTEACECQAACLCTVEYR